MRNVIDYKTAPPREGDEIEIRGTVSNVYGETAYFKGRSGQPSSANFADVTVVRSTTFVPGDLFESPTGDVWTTLATDDDVVWAKYGKGDVRRAFQAADIRRVVPIYEDTRNPLFAPGESGEIPEPPPISDEREIVGIEPPLPPRLSPLPVPPEGARWEMRDGLDVLVVPDVGWDLRGRHAAVAAAEVVVTESGEILKSKAPVEVDGASVPIDF